MSISTPTPSRMRAPVRDVTRVLEVLEDEGWRAEITSAPPSAPHAFAVIARGRRSGRDMTLVLHGFPRACEVKLQDVWRLVAHLNDAHGDTAVLCLGPEAVLSNLARETAERLGVVISGMDV